MRTFLKILLGVGILTLIAGFILFDEVDYSPYFESEYYQKTSEQLDSLKNHTHLSRGKLEVGFGRVSITPGIGDSQEAGVFAEIPMAGYGSREGASATGTHDSLYVSAVALQVGEELRILLSADMLIIPPNIAALVSEQLLARKGIQRGQVFFSATHTHASMGGWSDKYVGEIFAGKLNTAVIHWLSDCFVRSIEQAIADIRPGKIGMGSFQANEYVMNRVIGERGEEDGEFVLIKLEQLEGKTAVLGSFDAHATTLDGENMEFSADYPGYWRAAIEENGIEYAIFFAGSVGSHGPEATGVQFTQASTLGQVLADSVKKYTPQLLMEEEIEMASLTVELALPEFQIRVSDGVALAPYFGKKLFPSLGAVHVQALRLGNLIWATAPADFSGEFAIDLKNAMAREGFLSHITSFNGAYVGYIIPAKYFHFDAYESRFMSWFGPGIGPYIDEMIRRSMEGVGELQ